MRRLVFAILLVGGNARADFQSLASPGPLARAHAGFEDQCDKCHVPFKGIPDSACLACHASTRKHIEDNAGPHARFAKEARKCASCHADHKGEKHPLSPEVKRDGFDHARDAGVALTGKHGGVPCAGCHKPGRTGATQWIGIAALDICFGCHKDVHKGELGGNCNRCHSTGGWKPPTKTLEQHKVSMAGKHAGLQCAQCHAKGKHLDSASSCGDCHDQKHGGTKAPCETCHNTNDWKSATFKHDFCTCILPGKHQTAPCLACHPQFKFVPTPFACAACHKKDLKHEDLGPCSRCHSALSWKTKTFDHDKPQVGFPIEGKHTEVGCENCHKQKGVFRGLAKNCEGCHKVPKHGDFGGCAKCHTVAGWAPQNFSHDKTAFPLDGKHAAAGCATCHAKFKPGEFVKGPNECLLCHNDPHGGQFGEPKWQPRHSSLRLGVVIAQAGGHVVSQKFACRDCHDTNRWRPSTIDATTHVKMGWPLEGQHGAVPCARCHEKDTLGITQYAGAPHECAKCHLDRHGGRFGNVCEKCHDPSRWSHHPGFDHAITGFQLEGAHDGLACAQCHGKRREKLRGVGKITCATCHTPTHGDLFGTNCGECHKPTKFSDVPPFDHNRTLFPLDRRHKAVKCTTCHDARRGPRIDANCRFCHDDPHRGRTLLDCSECHRADVWRIIRFDHDRSEFPLRGKHFATPCRDCHANDQFTGVRSECVSCHRGDRLRAEMMHPDHRRFGFDCSECHRPFNW